MKIKFLFLAAVLGFVQLASAQTQTFSVKEYEPAPNTVQVQFKNGYTTSEQKTAEGNRMVVAYEQGLNFNFSLVSVYPAERKNENMEVGMEDRFMKLIGDQASAYKKHTGASVVPQKPAVSAVPGFSTNFVIGDYTYVYRIVVINNVYYLLSASYLTTNEAGLGVADFLNSFKLPTKTN